VKGLKDGSKVHITSATGVDAGDKVVLNQGIDVSDLPAGLFILDVRSSRMKFVKE
jgi:hypothetical protein